MVTLVATGLLATTIAQTSTGDTTTYRARFTSASGLRVGESVRIAGVQIGRVDGLKVVDHRVAEVRFSVEKGRALPASVTGTIKYLNIVGQRYLELGQGAGDLGTLPAGGVIPLERTRPALDLTQLFNGFQPLFNALEPNEVNGLADSIVKVLQGEGGTLDSLLTTVGSLTTTLATKEGVISQVVDNLNAVLKTINAKSDAFGSLVTTLRGLVSGLAQDRKPIGEAVQALGGLTETTADFLDDGREPLRKNIDQLGKLTENLADASPTVDKFLKNLPTKLEAISRLGAYGSWMNFYICEATVTGATYKQYEGETPPQVAPVTGDPARCGR
ncbi:MlaD family protein [Actinocorallia longicatena]|uniref:MlaD family protein n=1 Tax=Actinocorallia longicatena TaxID=111803 RepID=A0ABP6QMG0_9ACTN